MKKFIITVSDDATEDKVRGLLYLGNASERPETPEYMLHVVDVAEVRNQEGRMTFEQREKLWAMCGSYRVPFREDDYSRTQFGTATGVMYEGFVGGREMTGDAGRDRRTIYVAVEPDGRSHT